MCVHVYICVHECGVYVCCGGGENVSVCIEVYSVCVSGVAGGVFGEVHKPF